MEIEKLFISLALDAAKYAGGLQDAQKQGASFASRIKSTIGGGLQTAAKIGTTALLGVGLTLGGVAAKGVNDFIAFENQMNEVFTLLPGITQDAMDEMSDDVLAFSRDMAVLPEEVVPALYQSLSAGVPPDNVFDFLETAQKAAVGGITELETAVDGITSVVNAYGAETIGAAKASDIMFTAVRLGKTDFGQLSASLFNVIPTAASLGISFEEVAAGMATLTAQGTPTSVATTQLRSLFVEATKDGSKLDQALRDMAGVGLTQMIAEGDNVVDVLGELRSNMSDDEFRNLFGSVEALNAALGITGPNAEMMYNNLRQMNDAAGATDAAFEQMNGGIGRSIERFKAFASTALIEVGDALSPVIDKGLELAEQVLPILQTGLETVTGIMTSFFANIEEGMTPLDAFIEAIWDIAPPEVLEALVNFRDNILPGLMTTFENLWASLQPVIDQIVSIVTQFVSWQDVAIALGAILGGAILAVIANLVVAIAPVVLAVGAVIAIIAVLRNAWEQDWGGIRSFIEEIAPQIQEIITTFIQFVQSLWLAHGEQTKSTISELWSAVKEFFSTNLEAIKELVRAFIALFQGDWEGFVNHIYNSFKLQVEALVLLVARLWLMIAPKLTELINNVKQKFQEFDWKGLGQNIIEGIANGISAGVSFIADAARNAAQAALDAAKAALGIDSPSKMAAEVIGKPFTQGIAVGIERANGFVDEAIGNVLDRALASVAKPEYAGAGVVNNSGGNSYNSETTINLPAGADPMRAIRASRHLDKLGRGAG